MDEAKLILRVAERGAERPDTLHAGVYAKGQARMDIFDCFGWCHQFSSVKHQRTGHARPLQVGFYERICTSAINSEFARFSQHSITRNYEPSSRTARNCAEQGVGFCGQRSALCVRDCRTHGSHNAAMCDFSAVHTKRQPIAEFCAKQGVGFCTRGSVRRYVTERAWFPQRSITRNYALAILERLSLSIAIFSFSFLAASR